MTQAVETGGSAPAMKAVLIDRHGGPEELRMGLLPRPVATPGTVLIKTCYAGVNPADWKIREGWLSVFFSCEFPFVLGFDLTGVIAEIGEGVSGFSIGDRVVAASNQGMGQNGAYAEYALASAERTVIVPDTVRLDHAACLPTAGMTAWEAVFDVGQASAGKKILVNGGAGGTGSFAIQLARMAGASVAATCGPDNLEYVRQLGAELAINYRTDDVGAAIRKWAPDGLDLVIDTVGQGTLLDAVEWMKPGGVIAPIATMIVDEAMPDSARAEERGVRIVPTMSSFANQGRQLRGLVDALAHQKIVAPKIEILPVDQVRDAHERVAAGHVRGKLLLQIGQGGSR